MKALKLIGKIFACLLVAIAAAMIYVKTAMPNTGPAPEIKIERTAVRIERGKYLANKLTVCMDCQSSCEWSRCAGVRSGANKDGKALFPVTANHRCGQLGREDVYSVTV